MIRAAHVFWLAAILSGVGCQRLQTEKELTTARLKLPIVVDEKWPEIYLEFEKVFRPLAIERAERGANDGLSYAPPYQEALETMGYSFPDGSRFFLDNLDGTYIIENTRKEIERVKRDFSMIEIPIGVSTINEQHEIVGGEPFQPASRQE
jgi:hypothetical protein